MSKEFDRLELAIHRIDLLCRSLGQCKSRFLSDEVRSQLIDELIEDSLEYRHPKTVLIDVMKNGCVGYNYFPDLVLCEVLRDDWLERGLESDGPPITDLVVRALRDWEIKLLKEE